MPQTPQTAPAKPIPPAEFREGDIASMDAAGLIRIVTDAGAPEFRRAKACVRIGELGAKEAVPALAALLDEEHLSVYARYGLEPIPDGSVDEALRAALAKLKGVRLIGVINSIGKRSDEKAGAALARLLHGADTEVARAAAAALGRIGSESSVKELQGALGKTSGMTRTAVADACLVGAERLLANGKRERALAVYAALSALDIPKPVRLAAMSGIIREETAIGRPR